jgi:hypothetical protein
MKRVIHDLLVSGMIPFVLNLDGSNKVKLNPARIMEALIIAGVGGMLAAYITTAELKMKLTYQELQIQLMRDENKQTCILVQSIVRDITRIDTLQQERIERERRLGIK